MHQKVNERRYARRIRSTKYKARSELGRSSSQWWHWGFARTFDLSKDCFPDTCPRIDAEKVSLEEFREQFESSYKPVVIVNDQLDWEANKKWTMERLSKKYRNQSFKCGEDDSGSSVGLKMKYFVHYMRQTQDDSPLYIFDANFGEHPKKKRLLNDYTISKFFPEDIFSYASNKRRPPHRWFVMGPARSGTGIHIDPLGTSAWNALVRGYKRWCLFPPQTPKELIKPRPTDGGVNRDEAIAWFVYVYPRTRLPDWPQAYQPIELLQHPGDTVFVPGGWWHVVLNLSDTIAVTQNFCSSVNFPRVWYRTVRSRPRFAQKWLDALREHRADLATVVDQMDTNADMDDVPPSSASSSSSSSSSSDSDSSTCSSSCSTCRPDQRRQPRPKLAYHDKTHLSNGLHTPDNPPDPKRARQNGPVNGQSNHLSVPI